jgi:hypothetical protein
VRSNYAGREVLDVWLYLWHQEALQDDSTPVDRFYINWLADLPYELDSYANTAYEKAEGTDGGGSDGRRG